MSAPPRLRQRTRTPQPAGSAAALLVWRDAAHFDHRDRPCILCGRPTPLRSHQREPVHKVCAETWNTENPGDTRFASDTQPRSSSDEHA